MLFTLSANNLNRMQVMKSELNYHTLPADAYYPGRVAIDHYHH